MPVSRNTRRQHHTQSTTHPPTASTPRQNVSAFLEGLRYQPGFSAVNDVPGPAVWSPIPGISNASVDREGREALRLWFYSYGKYPLRFPFFTFNGPPGVDIEGEHKRWVALLSRRIQHSTSLLREDEFAAPSALCCR